MTKYWIQRMLFMRNLENGVKGMDFHKPNNNIAEVTLIGTGGGYGESIVVHLGNNNWIVIDSCVDSFTKDCLPLIYLKSINVDIEKDVKYIICTHWHDDHINGISDLLDACINSEFCIAGATDPRKFLQLIKLDYEKCKFEVSNSSTIELNKCIEILDSRDKIPKRVFIDKWLCSVEINESLKSDVYSLSPSDFTLQEFDKEISMLMERYGKPSQKIHINTPNDKSVVLFLKLGSHNVVLGADLEVSENNLQGWLNIIENSVAVKNTKSKLFKIPHHGSENGYHTKIWSELLSENPVAKLTPWNKNKKLPTDDMIKKYLEHTDKLFITSTFENDSPKVRPKRLEKMIYDLNPTLREIKYSFGLIRGRIDILNPNANWEVVLFDKAKSLVKK
jgi:beta-lactamase superfamily II metal-dependent hydrolase